MNPLKIFASVCSYQMIRLAKTYNTTKKQKVFILNGSIPAIIPLWQTDLIQTELVMQGDVTSRRQHWFAGLTVKPNLRL